MALSLSLRLAKCIHGIKGPHLGKIRGDFIRYSTIDTNQMGSLAGAARQPEHNAGVHKFSSM